MQVSLNIPFIIFITRCGGVIRSFRLDGGGKIDRSKIIIELVILLRYLASSTPPIIPAGVGTGAGLIPPFLALPTRRNPPISNISARRAPTGPPLAEVSGLTGSVHSFPVSHAPLSGLNPAGMITAIPSRRVGGKVEKVPDIVRKVRLAYLFLMISL
jgi:hypothetical protein